jgi:hypothetical protein
MPFVNATLCAKPSPALTGRVAFAQGLSLARFT